MLEESFKHQPRRRSMTLLFHRIIWSESRQRSSCYVAAVVTNIPFYHLRSTNEILRQLLARIITSKGMCQWSAWSNEIHQRNRPARGKKPSQCSPDSWSHQMTWMIWPKKRTQLLSAIRERLKGLAEIRGVGSRAYDFSSKKQLTEKKCLSGEWYQAWRIQNWQWASAS